MTQRRVHRLRAATYNANEGFCPWDGWESSLTDDQRAALPERRLMIFWCAAAPGPWRLYGQPEGASPYWRMPPTGRRFTDACFVAILRAIRERSWEVEPLGPPTETPETHQIRRRQIGGDARGFVQYFRYIGALPQPQRVWPFAALGILPPHAEWITGWITGEPLTRNYNIPLVYNGGYATPGQIDVYYNTSTRIWETGPALSPVYGSVTFLTPPLRSLVLPIHDPNFGVADYMRLHPTLNPITGNPFTQGAGAPTPTT